ncbi:hypothetical protein D1872_331600 [compost metagenome]
MILVDDFGGVEFVTILQRELGNDIVVVGVEPLCHLHRDGILRSPCHSEIAFFILKRSETCRYGTKHDGGVEHVVIE